MKEEPLLSPRSLQTKETTRLEHAAPETACSSASSVQELLYELRAYQLELEESRDRFADFYDLSPVACLTLTDSGLISDTNLTGTSLLRTDRSEILQHPFADFVIPEHADRWHFHFASVLGQDLKMDCELTLQCSDSTLVEVRLNSLRLVKNDRPAMVRVVLTDITERKQIQDALQTASRRKDEFLAILSHELRNPLAPMRNALEILKLKGSSDPVLKSARDMIDNRLQYMTRLVDDLLDANRISQGILELKKERLDLTSILGQSIEASQADAEQAGLSLTVAMPPHPVWLDADPLRLEQVFLNLLVNACKFTDKGGHIRVTAEVDGQNATIRFADNGIGIAPEHQSSLFEMFRQVTSSETPSLGGLGIGLSLAKSLVELHGGRIEVNSEGIGKGSEFIVRLPILDRLPDEAATPEQRGDMPDGMSRRILVVDDQEDITASLVMLLEIYGHQVETAHDGLEAVETARRYRPDVVLLDIGLPRLDGYEVCRLMREQPWGRDMQIIAMTGWAQEGDRQKSDEAGFDLHLVKPVDPAALMNMLGRRSIEQD